MTAPFETDGFWHTPDSPSRQIAGTLRYSPEDGLKLSLTGSFSEDFGSDRKPGTYPLIHGIVNDSPCGNAFTLVNCFRTKRSVRMPGFATEEIRANRAYAGSDFLSEGDLLFDSASLELSALDSWISTTGISLKPPTGEAGERQARYLRPENISFALDVQTLKIVFGWSDSQSHRSYSLREKVGVKIENLGQISSERVFQQYIYPLQNFFTLATDRPNVLDSIVLCNSRLKATDDEQPFRIHYLAQPIYVLKEAKTWLQSHDMLFTYEDVKDHLPNIFRRWFEFAQTFKPFCLSYFGLIYAPDVFVDTRFISLIESMVLLFRELNDREESLDSALNDAVRAFQARCSRKESRWLMQVMPTLADVSLPWSLAATLDEHSSLMVPLIGESVESFVERVLTTYKYCRYRDSALLENSAQGAELYWLIEKLKVLVKALILEWLGIPRELVERLIKRNRVYSHLAGLSDSA